MGLCGYFYAQSRLMGEASAPFGAAVSEHFLAGPGSHTFHKAVLAAALSFFRLISLLRHGYYLNINPLDTPRP